MRDGTVASRRIAEAFVATNSSLREFTRENMAPYFHDDVTWQAGVMRLEGIDIFIAANNQAWQTLGYPAVRDVESDAGEDFAVVGCTLAGTHELPMMGQAATGKRRRNARRRECRVSKGYPSYPVPRTSDRAEPGGYSHSTVAGGFEVMSYTTRLTCGTSLTMRFAARARTSYGRRAQSAVM